MKKLLILLLIAFACQAVLAQGQKGDTITVILSETIVVKWNVKNSALVQDDAYLKLKENKKNLKPALYDLIADLTPLGVKACFKKENLRNGDIAFNLFDSFYSINYFRAFNQQFDLVYLPCIPPDGLYDYLEANRTKVANDLRAFYAKK